MRSSKGQLSPWCRPASFGSKLSRCTKGGSEGQQHSLLSLHCQNTTNKQGQITWWGSSPISLTYNNGQRLLISFFQQRSWDCWWVMFEKENKKGVGEDQCHSTRAPSLALPSSSTLRTNTTTLTQEVFSWNVKEAEEWCGKYEMCIIWNLDV